MSLCDRCVHVGVCEFICYGGSDEVENCRHYEEERPHGEWVSKPKRVQVDETDEERIFETQLEWFCSSCGKSFDFRKPDDAFCKYCGSDNRKRGEAE